MSGYEKMVKKLDRIYNEIEGLEFMCNDQELSEEIKSLKENLVRLRRRVMAKHHHKSAEVRPGPTIHDLRTTPEVTIYKDCIVIFGD